MRQGWVYPDGSAIPGKTTLGDICDTLDTREGPVHWTTAGTGQMHHKQSQLWETLRVGVGLLKQRAPPPPPGRGSLGNAMQREPIAVDAVAQNEGQPQSESGSSVYTVQTFERGRNQGSPSYSGVRSLTPESTLYLGIRTLTPSSVYPVQRNGRAHPSTAPQSRDSGWVNAAHLTARAAGKTHPLPQWRGGDAARGADRDQDGRRSMQTVTALNRGSMSVTTPPRTGASSSMGTLAKGASMHMGLQGTVGMHGLYIVLLSC